MRIGLGGRASLYKWYAKAVALKRDDPELFRALADLARPGIEEHGVDEESGVASFLREFDRDGIDPRTAVAVLATEEDASAEIGEAIELRWGDIDLGARTVRVERRFYRGRVAPP